MHFRIAIDMDEVLADTIAQALSLYNRQFGANLSRADLQGKSLWDVVPREHLEQVQTHPRSPGFFRDIPVMPGSLEVLPELCRRHEVFIATAAMLYPNCFTEKYDWLKEHFPCIADSRIVFCGDKHIIAADYLIDDHSQNFRGFSGKGLLYDAPHNHFEQGYERLENWEAIRRRFLA